MKLPQGTKGDKFKLFHFNIREGMYPWAKIEILLKIVEKLGKPLLLIILPSGVMPTAIHL